MRALTASELRVRTARCSGATPLLSNAFGIGTCFDEIGDHLALCIRIPPVAPGTPVGGVVERFGSPSVASANVGALADERLGEFSLMRGGSDVQRRVAGVDVVTDRSKEVRLGILAARSDTNRTGRETRRCVEPSRDLERRSRDAIAPKSASSAPSSDPSRGRAAFVTPDCLI